MSETFSIKVENDQAILHLTSILDMSAANDLLSSLKDGVSNYNNLIMDTKDVERISTPCVQIMLSAALKLEKAGGKFSIINVSSGFERGMNELGLSDYLKNWSIN